MREAISQTISSTLRLPMTLQLIDLDVHPDGLLLRLCACLGRTRSAVMGLENAIECTPALTLDGCRMKELTL
jgi:hypothetical protein